jgi:3-oxoacyl-ACP reductase-like protein
LQTIFNLANYKLWCARYCFVELQTIFLFSSQSPSSGKSITVQIPTTSVAKMGAALDGQVAIVTGGSRGIGAGIARELAKRGAHVALTYVSSLAKAQAVIDDIES